MKRLLSTWAAGFLALALLAPAAIAQTAGTIKVVGTCGTATYVAGKMAYPTQDTTGKLCSSGSGGGGAVTIADGADVAEGAKADAAYTGSGNATVISSLKAIANTVLGNAPSPVISVVTNPTNTPTISTSAYVTGYVLGGIQSFTSQPNTGAIANANVTFDSGSFSAGTVDLYLFNASPTGGGTTDHAAFALTATDTQKMIGVLHLSDCTSLGGVLAQCQNLYQSQFYGPLPASGTTIFAVAVVRGAPTFAGTTDVHFSLGVVK